MFPLKNATETNSLLPFSFFFLSPMFFFLMSFPLPKFLSLLAWPASAPVFIRNLWKGSCCLFNSVI